jgi:hypothetical protein
MEHAAIKPAEFISSCVAFELARSAACRMVMRFLYAQDYSHYAVFRSYVIRGTALPAGLNLSTVMTADPSCCKVVLAEVERIARMVASRSSSGMRTLWRDVKRRTWSILNKAVKQNYQTLDADSPDERNEESGNGASQDDEDAVRDIVALFTNSITHVKAIAMCAVEAVQRDCVANRYDGGMKDTEGGVVANAGRAGPAKPVQDAFGAVGDFFGKTVPVAAYDASRMFIRRLGFGRTSDAEEAALARDARLLADIDDYEMQEAYAMACAQITNQLRSGSPECTQSKTQFVHGVVQRSVLTDFGFWHALSPSFTRPGPDQAGSCIHVGSVPVILMPRTHFECMVVAVRRTHEVMVQLANVVLGPSELDMGPSPSEAAADPDPYDVWQVTPAEMTEDIENLNLLLLVALGGKAKDMAGQTIARAMMTRSPNPEQGEEQQLQTEISPGLAAVFDSLVPQLERIASANAQRLLAMYQASPAVQYKLWTPVDNGGTAKVETGQPAFMKMSVRENDQSANNSFGSAGLLLLGNDYAGSEYPLQDELPSSFDQENLVAAPTLSVEDRVRDAWRSRWGPGASYLVDQFIALKRRVDDKIAEEMPSSAPPKEALLTDRMAIWIKPPVSNAPGSGACFPTEWKLGQSCSTLDLDAWSPRQLEKEDEDVQHYSRCLASLMAIALSAFAPGVDVVDATSLACDELPLHVDRILDAKWSWEGVMDHTATLHGFGKSLASRRAVEDVLPSYRSDWQYRMRENAQVAREAMAKYAELAAEFVFTSEDAARIAAAGLRQGQ